MSYAWENLNKAVHALAGEQPQRERLMRAYRQHLMHLTPKDMPAESRAEFDRLRIEIRRCSVKQGRSLTAILPHISDHEVAAMVASIIRLYDAVARYQPLPAPPQHRGTDAPLYVRLQQ